MFLPALLLVVSATPAPSKSQPAEPVSNSASATEHNPATDNVKTLLLDQAKAWNAGDLDAFCSVYADDATFVSPSGVTQGRGNVLARYKKRYPDKAAMGTLSFEFLETRVLKGNGSAVQG